MATDIEPGPDTASKQRRENDQPSSLCKSLEVNDPIKQKIKINETQKSRVCIQGEKLTSPSEMHIPKQQKSAHSASCSAGQVQAAAGSAHVRCLLPITDHPSLGLQFQRRQWGRKAPWAGVRCRVSRWSPEPAGKGSRDRRAATV